MAPFLFVAFCLGNHTPDNLAATALAFFLFSQTALSELAELFEVVQSVVHLDHIHTIHGGEFDRGEAFDSEFSLHIQHTLAQLQGFFGSLATGTSGNLATSFLQKFDCQSFDLGAANLVGLGEFGDLGGDVDVEFLIKVCFSECIVRQLNFTVKHFLHLSVR